MQEVRTFGEDAMKVQDIRTMNDLERYANQRGLLLWGASEMVASLGRHEKRHGIYVAHVADETGAGYVYWFDEGYRDSQRGVYHVLVTVRATREEALAEAREMYEEALRGEVSWQDPEWYGVPDEQQLTEKDEAIHYALVISRLFLQIVRHEERTDSEPHVQTAARMMKDIVWWLERVAPEIPVKVEGIETRRDLERFFAQHPGRDAETEGELVGAWGGSEDSEAAKFYLAHVADDSGEGYVFWTGRTDEYDNVNVHATRKEALAEAREAFDRMRGGSPNAEWYAEEVRATRTRRVGCSRR